MGLIRLFFENDGGTDRWSEKRPNDWIQNGNHTGQRNLRKSSISKEQQNTWKKDRRAFVCASPPKKTKCAIDHAKCILKKTNFVTKKIQIVAFATTRSLWDLRQIISGRESPF